MENPEALAGADIETADVTFDVLFAFGNAARLVRRTDDDGIPATTGGMKSDVGLVKST
jgi:hypothetical protein